MFLTNIAIKWKPAVYLLMILITTFGILAYNLIPRELNPDVKIPIILVSSSYDGASPSDMESLVTLPIERKLKGLDGVKKVSSYSAEGSSTVVIEFLTNQDINDALQKVKDKVDQAKRDLPADMTSDPNVMDINMSDFPVMVIGISGEIPEYYMKKISDEIKEAFEGIKGVQEVGVSGVRERIILVEFDYERLQAYNLNLLEMAEAIKSENVNIPGGSIDIGKGKYILKIPGEFTGPDEIDRIVLTTRNGLPIYLKDVATIKDDFEDRETYARLNKVNTVALSVKKRTGENVIYMAQGIKEVIAQAEKILPPTVKIQIITDYSKYIVDMLHELQNSLATGLFLVVLVMFLFLGKTNSLFIALAIPFSMFISFIVFQYLDLSLNMIVLFSLIMALGMLVDDAIVIVENTYRHMQEGKDRVSAAKSAAAEVGIPIVASKLTTLCAFFPLLFWPGITGKFMMYVPLTLIITLTASFFVAMIFNPVICSSFMRVKKLNKIKDDGEKEIGKWMQKYSKIVNNALDHRKRTLAIAVAFLFIPIFLFGLRGLGVEFFPESDPKTIMIKANSPQGTNAFTTLQNLIKIEEAANGEEDVELILTQVGNGISSLTDSGSATHLGMVTVEFVPFENRKGSSIDTINRIREKLGSLPGSEVTIEKDSNGPPKGSPVSIEISGPDFNKLGEIAEEIRNKIQNVPGLVDLKDDYIKSKPELRIIVDREKAALLGLSTSSISYAVKGAISGMKVGVYRENDEEYDIIVRLPMEKRQSIDDIKNLQLPNKFGKYVPLSSVAELEVGAGFGQVTRQNFKRVVNVTANADGKSGMEVLANVKQVLNDFEMPANYSINYTGEDENQKEAVDFLGRAFLIAVFLIIMVLLIEFNSVSQVMIIMATVLLSTGGVFWGLVITGTPFGIIMSGLGVISLAGVVVNNGIIMIDYMNKLREQGKTMRYAIVNAGIVRFRPVMLTAITAILGMLPMSLGYGINFTRPAIEKGAEMSQWWAGMANAVIFGLAFATILTLVVVPVLYSFTGPGLDSESKPPKSAGIIRKLFGTIKNRIKNK